MEEAIAPYRALAHQQGEVIDLELVGGYTRVIVERNNAFFVFMVKPPYVVASLCDDKVGLSEAEARELYDSFPKVLRRGQFIHWRYISAEKWGTESAFALGMMYVSAPIKVADLEFPEDRVWIFAWRLADGEVRFLPPERLDEAMKAFMGFLESNMKKVFERPSPFTPPAPEGAE